MCGDFLAIQHRDANGQGIGLFTDGRSYEITMETSKKSRWSYGQFERIMLPGWLFHPGYEELRRIAFIAYSTVFIAVITLIIIGSLRLIRHDTVRGSIDLSFALVMAGIIVYHRKKKRYHYLDRADDRIYLLQNHRNCTPKSVAIYLSR